MTNPNGAYSIERIAVEHERMTSALSNLSMHIPSTKGMGPKDRAERLHAELERRIAIAKKALVAGAEEGADNCSLERQAYLAREAPDA